MAFPKEWILLDKRGRITIPRHILKALGIDREKTPNAPLLIEAYPDLDKCTCLIVKKGY